MTTEYRTIIFVLCFTAVSTPRPHLLSTAKWAQNGITMAGSRGQGNRLNQLSSPYTVCFGDNKTAYIVDQDNSRIVEWKYGATSGKVVAGANGQGDRNDQLNYPTNVIVDKQTDSFIISDFRNRRVVRWSRQGGTSGETIISDIYSRGIAMDDDGFLYVSDRNKHEVRRWRIGETQGTLVVGGNGQGERLDQLNDPTFILQKKALL
jgi:sugar lactone lactonase YvrE